MGCSGSFEERASWDRGRDARPRGRDAASAHTDDVTEFLVLTRWESVEHIKQFAGADIAKAVVEPAAIGELIDFDDTVQHYESLDEI
jgi:heme-degrading monooxygenase HmoA